MSSEFEAKLVNLLDTFRPDLETKHTALLNDFANSKGFFYACLDGTFGVVFGFWYLHQRDDGLINETPTREGFCELPTVVSEIKRELKSKLDRNDLSAFTEGIESGVETVLFYLAKLLHRHHNDKEGRPIFLAIDNSLQYIDPKNNGMITHSEILRRLGYDPTKAESAGASILTREPSPEELQPLDSLDTARAAYEKNPGYAILKRKYANSILASGSDPNRLAIRLLLSAWSHHDHEAMEILKKNFFKDSGQIETLTPYRLYLSSLIDLS